jgi:two-component system sensor histidine kinase CiaH
MRLIRSATFKLTLWYLGIIMVLSILFSLALYRLYVDQLTININRQINAVERLPLPPQFQSQRDAYIQQLINQFNDERTRLTYQLLALNLSTLLVGGGGSYLLAKRTLKPVEEALEAQGRFTADASHELRTPLTAMRAEIEVALRDKQLSAEDARGLLASNLEEVNKLESLATGLLRLARFENALDPTILKHSPVKTILAEAVDRHTAQIAQHEIKIETRAGHESIQGDKASLVELISILVDNAIKYSPDKSTVRLSSAVTGHSVILSVADEGMGIKAADIPHIFSRFYRADRSRSKQNVEGYGLGLSIAKRIIDLHRGEVQVTSTPGQGSSFLIKLPVRYEAPRRLI